MNSLDFAYEARINAAIDKRKLLLELTKEDGTDGFTWVIEDREGRKIKIHIEEIIRNPGHSISFYGCNYANESFGSKKKNKSTIWYHDVCLGVCSFKLPEKIKAGDYLKVNHKFENLNAKRPAFLDWNIHINGDIGHNDLRG